MHVDWNKLIGDLRGPLREPRGGAADVMGAVERGATREEVFETLGMAIYMGAGPAAMYASHAIEAFDQLTSQKTTETVG